MAYDETNRGALFKNDKKEKDSQPDYTGNLNVNGKDMWISAWLKTAESGRKYMSLSVQEKTARTESAAPATRPQNAAPKQALRDMDDDIPF